MLLQTERQTSDQLGLR